MINTLFFDKHHPQFDGQRPGIWHNIAALFVIGYLIFGLVFVGVRGLSNGGIVFASLCTLWLLVGLAFRAFKFPIVLFLPLAYFAYLVVTGFQVQPYPTEYILKMVTIWLGAISLAAFIANGVSLKLIIGGFVVVFVVNMVAISIGYDGRLINQSDFITVDVEAAGVTRFSGLAGQQNLLLSLVFTLPFLFFALRTRVNVLIFIALALAGVITTFLTGSRSGIAFSALFILAGAVLLITRGPIRTFTMVSGLVFAIVALVFLTDEQSLSKIENSSLGEQVLVQRVISKIDRTYPDKRDILKSEFWPSFNQKPFVGHGPNMFLTVAGDGSYAHNNFAEIAVNGGIVGLLLYYAMYLLVAFGVINSPQKNIYLIAPLLFLILADNWYVTYVSRPMVLCLCILLIVSFSFDKQKRRSHSRRRRRRA